MYSDAGSPDFEVHDQLIGNAMGQVRGTWYLNKDGCATSFGYDGIVYLKKPVLNSYMQLASTIGHEMSHLIFGHANAIRLRNSFDKAYYKAATEANSHLWEFSVQSPFYNAERHKGYLKTMSQY